MKRLTSLLSGVGLVAAAVMFTAPAAQAATTGPNFIETSHVAECGSITISLRNVSPWIYPVSVSTDGSEPNAAGPLYGPVVDNRTDGGVSGPQRDQTGSRTYSFEEGAGGGTVIVKYVVAAGTESDLYDDQPVGEVTTVEVDTDCAGPGTGDGGAGAGAGGGAGGGTGTDTPAGAPTGVLPAVGSAITGPLGPIGLAMVAAGSLLLWLNRSRLRGGRHSAV